MNPEECQHEETYEDDDGAIYCNDCGVCLAVVCDRCAGQGEILESEYWRDVINYDDDRITCPSCGGTGYLG